MDHEINRNSSNVIAMTQHIVEVDLIDLDFYNIFLKKFTILESLLSSMTAID